MTGMTYAKFFPSDWRTGCLVLNLEEEGLYIRFCAFMYDTGRAPPDDDVITSHLLNVQIQKYRKVMASLIAKGKIIRAQGILINERVQEEIDKYRVQEVARSEAARKREEARRMLRQRSATPAGTPQGTPRGTPLGTPGGVYGVPRHVPRGVTGKKPNDFNVDPTTAVPEQKQTLVNLESRSQNPEEDKLASKSKPPELAGLNGASEPMLRDIISWMVGGDEMAARNWLTKLIQLYGQEVVRDSYQKLSTDILSGHVIAQPLQTWGRIATRMRQEPRRGKSDAEPTASKRDQRRAVADAIAEKIEAEKAGRRV